MNNAALDKYNQMHRKLQHVNTSVRTMSDNNCKDKTDYAKRFPWLFIFLATKMLSTFSQLDEIEDAMSNLESTIMKLDAYSRSLETQVKKFEKASNLAARTTSP